MMETKLWTSPPIREKVHIIFKLFMYYNTWTWVFLKLRIMDGLIVHYISPF